MSPFAAGLVAIIAILLFSYLGFTKFANPFASPYTVHAIFSSANGLRPNSFVRIAGVNVGTVKSVSTVSGCKVSARQHLLCCIHTGDVGRRHVGQFGQHLHHLRW